METAVGFSNIMPKPNLRVSAQKNQKLSGKFQNFKIAQTLAISGPYWTTYRCVVHLSSGVLFRQKMTMLDFGARR